ncbi:MAG: tyrosine--tRNA ligase [Solirubrobacteraceae bacterium]
MAMDHSAAEQLRILLNGIVQVVPEDDFRRAIADAASGERAPLRVKFGVDPTRPDLHLGHAVPLRKLRQFQELGHTAILVIGGFTAQVGDPSGRSEQRTVMTAEAVMANAKTYLDQVGRVLLDDRLEIVNNADWLGAMRTGDVLEISSRVTVAQVLERSDFASRMAANEPLSMMEMFYPILQGQDSVAIGADVEIGGTDQTFNLLMGRDLQAAAGQAPQVAMTLPLLAGLDGKRKMSKSYDNYVAFEDVPDVMYRKLLGVPEPALEDYLRLTTDLHPDEVDALLTMWRGGQLSDGDVAERLARDVVGLFYGADTAARVAASFAAS